MEFSKAAEFFELSQDLFCVIGADGFLKKVNSAFTQTVGYTNEELLSKPCSAFLHSDDLAAFETHFKHSDPSDTLVNRFRCSDGTFRWFSWQSLMLSGEPVAYALVKDISKQRLFEDQLKASLQFNQRLLNSSLDLICSLDNQGYFVAASNASQSLLGYSPGEMIGNCFSAFLHPEDLEVTSQAAQDMFEGAELTNFENRYIHKSGALVPLVWSSKWSAQDQVFYCVARNASEKRKQHAQVLYSERRFKGLVQTGSDLIAIIGLDGVYRYVSPTISNILGYDPSEFENRSVFDFIHPDHLEIIETALQIVSQQYRVELPLFQIKNAKGEWRWMKTVVTNLINEESIQGLVANSRDVTDQIKIESQKQKAIERLNNLIENYNQGYFRLDRDWIIKGVNPATLQLLGLSEDRLIGKSITELFPNGEGASYHEFYERALSENELVEFEEKMLGSNRWFHISAYPYEGELTVFFKDITEEKLQQLLVTLEKKVLEIYIGASSTLKNAVDCYLNGLTEIYHFKCFLSLYDNAKSLLVPFSAPTFPKILFDKFLPGFSVSLQAGSCGAAALNREPYIVRDICLHPSFATSSTELVANNIRSAWSLPLIDAKGNLVGTIGVFHNTIHLPNKKEHELLTRVAAFLRVLIESQQVKDRLLISNERYKYITYATNDATYDWDILNELMYWGEGESKLFGYTKHISTLEEWALRVHPDDRVRVSSSLAAAVNDPTVSAWQEEYQYQRADLSYALVIDDGYILRDENKQPLRMVGALKDITKIKESANHILKQNQRLQEIATINSHHIRKPLANILGLIDALQTSGDNQEELLNMLDESGKELDKIVRKIAMKTLV